MNHLKTPKAKGNFKATRKEIKQENKHAASKTSKPKAPILVNHKILAERNQAIMPVGAWVESGIDCEEHPVLLASVLEEQHMELRREKEENLRRFQERVRRRVAQQARVHKRQQLQKTREMAEREGRVFQQSSETALNLTPGKRAFPACNQREVAICSSGSRWVSAQALSSHDWDRPGKMQEHQLSTVMKQVRHKLASCQLLQDGEQMSDLPGGMWKSSPTRSRSEEVEEDEILLIGQHDRPLDLQNRSEKAEVSERPLREPYPAGSSATFSTHYRASQVLWPAEDKDEMKKQRQSQFLMYRRLFMDIERAQVKELHRQRKHLRRIESIKSDKERRRLEEERQIQHLAEMEAATERERLNLEGLRLGKEQALEEMAKRERARKDRETTRFIEALTAQMKERVAQEKADLPPLCCCGESFWDSHPDTCANNCVFYHNPKAYAQALQSVLLNSDLREGSFSHRASARTIASIHRLSPRK
ncbi:coiled-coil domain-containing protein 15 [Brienomyrus brachyistius]|uniref:coiled-coil domain-containing protein 15 n=1 Tax=Brienomyrus brachyistius TaxID=42636 RepID=UPI0020B2D39B|nr:coiled-coil domain-containing protein 15 [Brienomyrus brachyistius]